MSRDTDQRTESIRREIVPLADKRFDEPPVRATIRTKPRGGGIQRALEEDGGAVVKRVREGDGWLDPFQAFLHQAQPAEERRRGAQRMDRGAEIVDKTGEGQRRGAAASADRVIRLIDRDGSAVARELDGGGEAVRSGSDNDGIERHGSYLAAPKVSVEPVERTAERVDAVLGDAEAV